MIKSIFSAIKNLFKPTDKSISKDTLQEKNLSEVINITPNALPPNHRLECDVYNHLKSLKTENMNLFWNLYIPYNAYDDTRYMEVDIIATTSQGIFVFECKDYTAHVSGDVNIQNWTAKYDNNETHKMPNPIFQNKQHIDVLSKFLSLPKSSFVSIVVMKFKTLKVSLGNNLLFVDDEYLKHRLKIALKMNISPLSPENLNIINSLLLSCMNPEESIKSKHRNRINNKFYK